MLAYYFKTALNSLKHDKWINLLCILTVGVSLLIVSFIYAFVYNVEVLSAKLPERFSIVAFFGKDASQADTQAFYKQILRMPEVLDAKLISKEEAMKELKQTLKDRSILEGLDENPLSASVEIKLKKDYISSPEISRITKQLKQNKIIDDVVYAEKTAETIFSLKRTIENLTATILISMLTGIIFVIYSTVKILFYRKKDEIEIMKLLGATPAFIRFPFLIEGGIIGLVAGAIAVLTLAGIYFALTYKLHAIFPFIKTIILPFEVFLILPIVGLLLGIFGSAIAIGRIRL